MRKTILKKAIVASALSLTLAVAVTGCAGTSPSPSSTGVVTLQFWTAFTGGDRPGYETLVKDFNASQKHIKVVFSAESGDTLGARLPAAILTSAGPDIATVGYDALEQFANNKSILPITDTGDGASKINTDKFAPALNDLYTFNGKLYGVPANFATLSLYYNKALFKQAGISGPPKTVTEFQADAKMLTSGDVSGLVLADHATIPMWPLLQWMSGGAVTDSKGCSVLDTPKGIASLQQWADLVVKDKISPVGLAGADADSVFSAGKAAMEMNGPWAAPTFKDAGIDLGIASIPTGVDGPVTLGNSGPLVVSAKSAHPKEAQEFLAYYTGKVAQLKFSLAQGFPSFRTDLSSDPALAADPVVSVFTKQVKGARFYPGKVQNASQVDANGYTPLIETITRGGSVKDAAATASTAIDGFTGCKK